MSKSYTVTFDDDVPPKLLKLIEAFGQVMLKKGYQVRVGVTNSDMAVLESTALEGLYFDGKPERYGPLCVGTDNSALHQRALRLFPSLVGASDVVRRKFRTACALVSGCNATDHSKMVIIYTPDGIHRYGDVNAGAGRFGPIIQAAELSNVPVLNLGHKPHRDRVIAMVKQATKKSAMQKFANAHRRTK